MKYTAIVDGDRLEIDPADIEDQFDFSTVEPGVYLFLWNNRSIEVAVTPNGDSYTVSIGSRRFSVQVVDPRAALRKAAQQGTAGTVELRAPMPGKVVKVLVQEGDSVELNQGLVVIEAMKMQNEMKSPKAGIVRRLGVKEAAAVNAGDLLAIVE